MRGVFDDEEVEGPRVRRDRELTLGTGSLLSLVFGLVLVCGLCFGLGYEAGRSSGRPAQATSQQSDAGAHGISQAKVPASKPSATSQSAIPQPAPNVPAPGSGSQPGDANVPQTGAAAGAPTEGKWIATPTAQQSSASNQAQVRPALPTETATAQTASASGAQPAVPPAVSLMVQIAAVSHEEDAGVLIGALRKHGYAVSAKREPVDNLIHVRIGPFNDRDEANRWRKKLLDDGYNAIIQP